jgi:hypothetical protein
VKDVIRSLDRADGEILVGQIAFEEFHALDVREIPAMARDEVVRDSNGVAAACQLFRQMRSDETCTAGDEIQRHGGWHLTSENRAWPCSRARRKSLRPRASEKKSQRSRKPNSVPASARHLRAALRRVTTIPLASPLLARSSDRPGSSDGPSVQQGPGACRRGC